MSPVAHHTNKSADDERSAVERLREFAIRFDEQFERFLTPVSQVPERMVEAVRYAALAPGKRLRPYLVIRCCELVGGNVNEAWPVAAAIECVHTFSLVHDDLPAMDDDALRRGRPTCHIQFDEATAVLAGDVLIILAFEQLARGVADAGLAIRLIRELAAGSGWSGMIGGQMDDISGHSHPPSLDRTVAIHERKTARLFKAACRMGALVGRADEAALSALTQFGQSLGLAFQIADDLLDVTANSATLGKRVGKDATARKQSFPRVVGLEESVAAARLRVDEALAALHRFDATADELRALARYTIDRDF